MACKVFAASVHSSSASSRVMPGNEQSTVPRDCAGVLSVSISGSTSSMSRCRVNPSRMAYMDVPPTAQANGRTIVLFHGKNFGALLLGEHDEEIRRDGYRVIAPDQIGWGKSSKPTFTTASSLSRPTLCGCSID